ncbi:MAG: HEAT repeat domain-containing protein [Actinomycetota bacterium]
MERLRRALRIRPGEGGVALRLLSLMLVAWTGFALGGNAVESLFFARFGPRNLPTMYIALGLITFPVTLGVSALLGRGDRRRILVLLPLALAVLVAAMRALLLAPGRWIYPALWLSMMVAWIVLGIVVWALAGAVHDSRQAKRLFPLYGAGFILGGSVGGLATAPLAAWLGAANLLFLWAASLVATSWMAASVVGVPRRRGGRAARPSRGSLLDSMREGYRSVRRSPLLRWMAVAMVLFGLLYFSLSLPFAKAATGRFPDADRLAGFLGTFTGAMNAAALAVSLLVANRLFARFGVAAMVVTFPVIYLVGFAALALTGTFEALVSFRFVQLVWMYGVWTSAWQALWGVVPPEHRDQARTFMDGGPMQAGIVLAGVLLLLGQDALTPPQLFAVAAVLAAGAVLAALLARRAYAGAVVEALRSGWPKVFVPEEEPFGGIPWDRAALSALQDGARDEDPGVRRIAVSILAGLPQAEAREVCETATADPDPGVRAIALRGLHSDEEAEVLPHLLRLLRDPDPGVRAAATDTVARLSLGATEDLRALLVDPDPHVGIRAAAALLRRGEAPEADALLGSLAVSADPALRTGALAALGELRRQPARLVSGLADPDPSVRRAAAGALARVEDPEVQDALLAALGDEEPTVGATAAEALAARGPSVAGRLTEALEDDDRADAALVGLARLPVTDPRPIRGYAHRERARALHDHGLWGSLRVDGDERMGFLAYALRARAVRHAIRSLRARAALGDRAAVEMAIENLDGRDAVQRANALETLEALGDPEMVRPLLAVWDPEPRARPDPAGALRVLLQDQDPWIRASAVLAATAVEGSALGDHLARLAETDPDETVRETARNTMKGVAVETLSTLPLMERMLALRRVPLFRELSPGDLKHVAEAATENLYPDGALVAAQGDPGDAMHIVVTGDVQVLVAGDDHRVDEVARRGPGYLVGEMAILSDEPRMASLVAVGDVRTLSLDRKRFQRIVRERPEAAVAVMRELCHRLREAHARPVDLEARPGPQ